MSTEASEKIISEKFLERTLSEMLNPWDADIVKRVIRSKEGEARTLDYEKIIHICKYRIAELSKEVLKETKVVAPAEAEKPVEDEESDDTTVFCLDETMKPAMFYIEGTKWDGKYVGYPGLS